MKSKKARAALVFALLIFMFFAAVVANVNTGSVELSPAQIARIICLREDSADSVIIWKLRLPRLLTASVLGGALALSGLLLQTFFRNPVAGPFVLGISSGAKMLLAVVTIVLSGHMSRVPISVTVVASFVGSMLSMMFVLPISGRVRSMSMLLVVGIMISYICSAVTDFLINFAKEADIVNLTHWSLGSFSSSTWNDVIVSAAIVIPTSVFVFMMSKPIAAYALGEGYALTMGVNVKLFRALLILTSSILSAVVTAFAGPISFVGVAVPHITRMMLGTSEPKTLIPASFLCGSVFCMICDLFARTALSPADLSVGTVTSAVGAPIVIWLMARRRSGEEG